MKKMHLLIKKILPPVFTWRKLRPPCVGAEAPQ